MFFEKLCPGEGEREKVENMRSNNAFNKFIGMTLLISMSMFLSVSLCAADTYDADFIEFGSSFVRSCIVGDADPAPFDKKESGGSADSQILNASEETIKLRHSERYRQGLGAYILTISPGLGAAAAEQLADKFIAAGVAQGVDEKLLMSICRHESRFSSGATAPDGGIGLMQIMPATGSRFGASRAALYEPQTNINVGAAVLATNMKTFGGDWNKALAAYAYGEGRVKRGQYTLSHANRFQGTYYQIKEFLAANGYPTSRV